MPASFVQTCTAVNFTGHWVGQVNENGKEEVALKSCQRIGPVTYVHSRAQRFQATTNGEFTITFANSGTTTVTLTILDRFAVYTDCGNLAGNYNESGTQNGKKKFVDSDGNALYYDDTNARWVISGAMGIAYGVASTADIPPLTGWQHIGNGCIGNNLRITAGEYIEKKPEYEVTVVINSYCIPEFSGTYKATRYVNGRPVLVGPNNQVLSYREADFAWNIGGSAFPSLTNFTSSLDVPTTGWRVTTSGITMCLENPNFTVTKGTRLAAPLIMCVTSLCGNYGGFYTQTGFFNERPDFLDEEQNRLFYWGMGDPNRPEGWYIADASNKYVYYNSSTAESAPTTGWQAFTGDGISCTGEVGVTNSATIAYDNASYCKSATQAKVSIKGTAIGTFSSTEGLSIDASTGAINPSVSTPGAYVVTYSIAGGCNATTSVTIDDYKTPSVAIAANPSGSITPGTSVTFTATPTNGGTSPTYVWKKNDAVIPNETGATFTTTTLTGGDKIKVEMTSNVACASPTTATSSEITISVCTAPTVYNITGGGAYCAGGTGVAVGLASSQTGVNYQLKNGSTNVGSPVVGTGSAISFGSQTTAGIYTVVATTGNCTSNMNSSVTVSITPLPTVYSVTGGGAYCAGGTGVSIGLSNSETGVSYQLKKGSSSVGNPVAGTGNAISFGLQTAAGTYTIDAIKNLPSPTRVGAAAAPSPSGGTCTVTMTGNAIVTVISSPTVYNVTGGGAYCAGGTGVVVGLASSQTGVNYQLKNGSANVGSPVAGTGSAISFGSQTTAGTYTVVASTATGNCTSNMNSSVTVSVTPLPTVYSVTGGGAYCAGGTGVSIGLSNSGTGVSYQLKRDNANVGSAVAGTGSTLTFGNQTVGVYSVEATRTTDGCTNAMTGSVTVSVLVKPAITLTVQQTTLNEGSSQTLCDIDTNPVNGLQFAVSSACAGGSLVWRVQVGNGAWSDWSTTSPTIQLSNNQAYRYQAACDANCLSTYTQVIALMVNYRASAPQNVSLVADGTSVAAGEEKTICDQVGNALTFSATCATGERLLYSVDGGVYLPQIPSQIVDGNFHNYRVRCQKSDGTVSCVETESGVMRLKISTIAAAPVASLSSTSGCGTPSSFSGTASCGAFTTVWYNAATNAALPNLPTTTPNETTSYYARCQSGEVGCLSEKSNTVTFTLTLLNTAPVVSVSSDLVCTGTEVTVSTTCPTGTTALWNTGVTESSFKVGFNNVTRQSYAARCVSASGCQSPVSEAKTVSWKAFELTIINIGQSKSAIKTNDRGAWASQFVTPDGGPSLDRSTESNPTLYYSENANKTGPRYWTIHADACALGTGGSLTFDMLATPESGPVRSFNTHENNAPYFMYANRDGYTELYAQNHPAYGFFQDNGSGGNVYDEGLPKGLYKLGVRYWDQKGWGSIFPSTRKPQGNVLAYQEYWFRIQSKDGIGVGAARVASDNILSSRRDLNPPTFAEIVPNPVSSVLRLKVTDAKNQKLNVSLMDASGRTLLQRGFVPETNTHQEEFNASEMANGMYFLKVNAGDKQATLKVVKVQ